MNTRPLYYGQKRSYEQMRHAATSAIQLHVLTLLVELNTERPEGHVAIPIAKKFSTERAFKQFLKNPDFPLEGDIYGRGRYSIVLPQWPGTTAMAHVALSARENRVFDQEHPEDY